MLTGKLRSKGKFQVKFYRIACYKVHDFLLRTKDLERQKPCVRIAFRMIGDTELSKRRAVSGKQVCPCRILAISCYGSTERHRTVVA